MELSTYIDSLKKSLQTTAAPAGKDVAEAAALLSHAIEPAARLSMLEALSAAADEITLALENASVEARLRGQEVEFVVNDEVHSESPTPPPEPAETLSAIEVARITLRLPESLKDSVEKAANAQSISVNGWLVGAIASAVDSEGSFDHGSRHGKRNRRFRGFARS